MRIRHGTLLFWVTSSATLSSSIAFSSRRSLQKILPRTVTGRGFLSTMTQSQQHLQRTNISTRLFMSSSSSPDSLRVALCQFRVTEDKAVNHETAASYMDKAAAEGADLIILPEIWNSPYATSAFPEYAETIPEIGATNLDETPSFSLVQSKAKEHNLYIVGGSIPEKGSDGGFYNTCLVFDPKGTVLAKHRKVHLFDIDVPGGITFFESDTLSPGKTVSTFCIPEKNNLQIGVGICYDVRFAEYAMLLAQKHNCKVIIYPGAFNMTTGPAHWELLQRGRAVDNQCYVMMASPARTPEPPEEKKGKYPHYTAWGHSTVVSPWGDVLATRDETEGIVIADLDLKKVDEIRQSIPITKQKRPDLYKLEETAGK